MKTEIERIQELLPTELFEGSKDWREGSPVERRMTLEHHRILLTEQQEIMAALKGVQSQEPVLW